MLYRGFLYSKLTEPPKLQIKNIRVLTRSHSYPTLDCSERPPELGLLASANEKKKCGSTLSRAQLFEKRTHNSRNLSLILEDVWISGWTQWLLNNHSNVTRTPPNLRWTGRNIIALARHRTSMERVTVDQAYSDESGGKRGVRKGMSETCTSHTCQGGDKEGLFVWMREGNTMSISDHKQHGSEPSGAHPLVVRRLRTISTGI